jgi:AcrR family transcriptional regulator
MFIERLPGDEKSRAIFFAPLQSDGRYFQEEPMDQNTFQLILSAAEQLVNEKGCQKTTLNDIMERTGLSKGAIYHYVKSKDELFGKILQGYVEQTNERFLEAVKQSKEKNVQQPVQAILASLSERNVSNPIIIYLLSQQHNPKISDMLSELHQSSLSLSKAWIKVGQDHGAIPADVDADAFASMFVTLSYGLRVNQMVDKDQEQQASLQQMFFKFMISALQKKD